MVSMQKSAEILVLKNVERLILLLRPSQLIETIRVDQRFGAKIHRNRPSEAIAVHGRASLSAMGRGEPDLDHLRLTVLLDSRMELVICLLDQALSRLSVQRLHGLPSLCQLLAEFEAVMEQEVLL